MRRMFWLFVLAALIVPVRGGGLIIVHDATFWDPAHPHPTNPPGILPRPHPDPRPRPPEWRHWAPLEVSSTRVESDIRDQVATTTVEQEFYNPRSARLEGTFLFPVPKGAQIETFRMEINGEMVEAELLGAEKARGIYENIVRKLKDPALLEYSGRDLFKVRIFPIEPQSRKKVTLRYSEVLRGDSGLVSYVFPLNTEKYAAKPVKKVAMKVSLETSRSLKSVFSHSHTVNVKRDGDRRALMTFEASDLSPDTDFELLFSQEEGEFGLSLLTRRETGEEGYFLMLVSPGAGLGHGKLVAKDITFVLDTSGSMAGEKLVQAKKALLFCVENLNDGDRFDVLRFSTEVEPLFEGLQTVGAETRARAKAFIEGLKPIGGTAIDEALRKALALRPKESDRPYVVVFLTDGRPTVGATDTDSIVRAVTREKSELTRVFCFGIGTDVNTHLLDRITEQTKAFSQYVLPTEDLELKVSSFYTKIKEPVLTDLSLKFPSGVKGTKTYPAPLPDLFRGQQLVVLGRYSGSGGGTLQISGVTDGEPREFTYEVEFADESRDHEFIPRLWATRRVGYLLDEMRLHGESQEVREEITELARRYGIVTPYTSYLIVEDEKRRDVPMTSRTLETDSRRFRLASDAYSDFLQQNQGDGAVAGARYSFQLKNADSVAPVLAEGNAEVAAAARPVTRNPSVATEPLRSSHAAGLLPESRPSRRGGAVLDEESHTVARFVGGRAFYKSGNKWIDAGVQERAGAKRIRLEFGSEAYFTFVANHPNALKWMSLGQEIEFVLGSVVYEIHSPSE